MSSQAPLGRVAPSRATKPGGRSAASDGVGDAGLPTGDTRSGRSATGLTDGIGTGGGSASSAGPATGRGIAARCGSVAASAGFVAVGASAGVGAAIGGVGAAGMGGGVGAAGRGGGVGAGGASAGLASGEDGSFDGTAGTGSSTDGDVAIRGADPTRGDEPS